MAYNQLTPKQSQVIKEHGTEAPYSGEYDQFYENGTYVCRQCNAPLFSSKAKFEAGCGWPAFDDSFPNSVKRVETDSKDIFEILCDHCGGHLGHEFLGEKFTKKDTRHCVNSLSIKFVAAGNEIPPLLTND